MEINKNHNQTAHGHASQSSQSLGSNPSTRASQGKLVRINKKTILITAGIVLLIILLGYFLITSLVSSQLKKFSQNTSTAVSNSNTTKSSQNTKTIVSDDRVLIYTDPSATNPTTVISEAELNKLSPAEREQVLNNVVDDATNIKNATGITNSGSGSEFKPIIAGGIITGVATGTGALPGASGNVNNQASGTGAVAPSSGSLQAEIDAIRNKGN